MIPGLDVPASAAPEVVRGFQAYGDMTLPTGFLDERSVCWSMGQSDDYLPNLCGPLQVAWTVSRECNFHCRHCFNRSSPKWSGPRANPRVIMDRLIEARPYNICLCGGEPLVWKDLYDIIGYLRNSGILMVSLVTNGFLLTEDVLNRLRDTGLSKLQVSIDGLTPEQHGELRTVPDSHARCVAAVEAACRNGWREDLAISMTPTRNNISFFRDYVRKFVNIGVRHIRLQPFMPMGRGADNQALAPSDEQYQLWHVEVAECKRQYETVTLIDWGDPLEHLWAYAFTAVHPWQVAIQTDGWFELSSYVPLLVGSVIEHSVEDFWARGVKRMWEAPILRHYARQMRRLSGMAEVEPRIYEEESLHIDVFDDAQWELLQRTEDLAVLRAVSEQNLARLRLGY